METYSKKTITNLTVESVSILTQQFQLVSDIKVQIIDGVETPVNVAKEVQVGENHRCAYANSAGGRTLLIESEPEDIVAEIMEVWGDAPTVEDFKFDEDYVPEPTAGERIAQLEEQVAIHEENDAELLYQICLLQLGITEGDL